MAAILKIQIIVTYIWCAYTRGVCTKYEVPAIKPVGQNERRKLKIPVNSEG